jgi:hypothetical protein
MFGRPATWTIETRVVEQQQGTRSTGAGGDAGLAERPAHAPPRSWPGVMLQARDIALQEEIGQHILCALCIVDASFTEL